MLVAEPVDEPTTVRGADAGDVVIALAGWIWHRACRNKFVCALLDKLVLGAVSASGVLGLGATVFGGAVRFGVLAGASIVATLGMLGIYFLRCREDCCE